jgi:hypothetical protein
MLSSAPSSGVSWTHGGVSNSSRLHTHLLQRELLGASHSPMPSDTLAAADSTSIYRSAADGPLISRESDPMHWSQGGPNNSARLRDAGLGAGAASDSGARPRATGLAADARNALLAATPPRPRIMRFGSPRRDADGGGSVDNGSPATVASGLIDTASENTGRGSGSPAMTAHSAETAPAAFVSDGRSPFRSSSAFPRSAMSPLMLAAAAASSIRSQSLVSLTAGSEELLRSPKRTRRKISRVPYKVLDAPSLAVSVVP